VKKRKPRVYIPGTDQRREISFSGELKDYLFSDTLLPLVIPSEWDEPDVEKYFDPDNKYTLNSYFYRGPEFTSEVDILAAGCSQTFGIGVPDDGTWPSRFSEITGLSTANLSAPGAGIEWIIDSIFKYIETFGPPKKGIVALFPDLFRLNVLVDDKINTITYSPEKDFIPHYRDKISRLSLVSYSPTGIKSPKILKRPFPIEYTTSYEQCIKKNVARIRDLDRYCKVANIPLVWSSWSDSTVWLYQYNQEQFKSSNFIELNGLADWQSHITKLEATAEDPEGIVDHKLVHSRATMESYGCSKELAESQNCVCFSECHFELQEKFPDSFHMGTDRKKHGKESAHLGVHRLIHIAEDFANHIKKWDN
jgi:hypothetical protein